MLRIHDRGIPRAQPKEGRIETIDVIKERRGPDVFRISKIRRGRARRDQLLIVKHADRFDAVAQIPPELTDIACSGNRPAIPTTAIDVPGKMFSASLIRLRPNRYGLHRAHVIAMPLAVPCHDRRRSVFHFGRYFPPDAPPGQR